MCRIIYKKLSQKFLDRTKSDKSGNNSQTIFFGADDAPQLQQMKSKFIAKYDFDGKKAMQLRQQWWQEGKAQNWTFLFYHDIVTPVYQM